MKSRRDLLWILPSSLVLGLLLSLLGPGIWWIGWLAYSILLILGLLAISALWRSSDSPHALGWMMLLALVLRLGMGIFFSYVLPVYGNDNEVHHGGYIYRDAFTYDSQAWGLAASGDPLWKAFDRSSGIEEQYGGLTFTLSLTYRLLSPDAHRPWLTILLSALMGALGVALAWKGARQAWGEGVALALGWIMALYPESLFSGSSQIREPFLLLFIAMLFWAAATWQGNRKSTAWVWMAGGTLGLFLFSPGIAVATLIILGVWVWLVRKEVRIRWWWVAGVAAVIVLAGLLFSQIVAGTLKVQGGPLANLVNWLKYSMNFGAYVTTLNSGWLQTIFRALPESLHLPFIVAYGIAQPVLPAAIADPAVWPVRLIGILRGLGWYALLPLLIYGLRPIWKTTDKRARMAWLWLWLAIWFWIILASARAGGDQWDNPRYRVILLMFQAAVAAYSLLWARQRRDRWWGRVLAVEGVFLAFFGYWYIARYTKWRAGQVHIFVVIVAIVIASSAILVGGWILDRRRNVSR
jgi:peptidoglycan/LPS O-acetylase OafA/YrhL